MDEDDTEDGLQNFLRKTVLSYYLVEPDSKSSNKIGSSMGRTSFLWGGSKVNPLNVKGTEDLSSYKFLVHDHTKETIIYIYQLCYFLCLQFCFCFYEMHCHSS